jgi:hypothetical protein
VKRSKDAERWRKSEENQLLVQRSIDAEKRFGGESFALPCGRRNPLYKRRRATPSQRGASSL